MDGWIKDYRKKIEWEWFTDVPVAHLFEYLLLAAEYEPRKWQGHSVGAGELLTTIASLADRTGLSSQQVRTALSKLQSTGEISVTTTNKNTLVKVLNYGNYQGQNSTEQQTNNKQSNKQITNAVTNEQQTNNKQHTIIKEIKNTRNKEIKKSIFTAPSVAEVRAYCIEKNYHNVDAEQFVDFYSSKGWLVGKSKMKDWKAAVRTWERRHIQEQKGKWSGTDSQYDNQF